MKRLLQISFFVAILSAGDVAYAARCPVLNNILHRQAYRTKANDIAACVTRGVDPPQQWRPNRGVHSGVRIGAGSSTTITGQRSPKQPPGSSPRAQKAEKEPPTPAPPVVPVPGFPLIPFPPISIPWPGGGGDDSCEIRGDAYKIPEEPGSVELPCMGTVEVPSQTVTLARDPKLAVFIREGDSSLHVYERVESGGKAGFKSRGKVPFPKQFCVVEHNKKKGKDEIKIISIPPEPQTIMVGPNTNAIAVKLQEGDYNDNPDTVDEQLYKYYDHRTDYLMIPYKGNRFDIPNYQPSSFDKDLKPPAECVKKEDLLGNRPTNFAEMMLVPTQDPSCQVVYYNPESEQCKGDVLNVNTGYINLVHDEGASAAFEPVLRTDYTIARGTQGALLQMPGDTELALGYGAGIPAGPFSFPEGVKIAIANDYYIIMPPPAQFSIGNGKVQLKSPGSLMKLDGSKVRDIGAGSTVGIDLSPANPLSVYPVGAMEIDESFAIPTMVGGRLRLPEDN